MKDNNLTLFSHPQLGEIRVQQINGEPLFCLTDVCRVLELITSKVVQRLSDDVLSKYPIIDAIGRTQFANFVNEDGLYDVILDSRKPEARKFRKWVTSEVLPQIRKTGGYIPVNEEDDEKTILCKAVMILQRTIEKKDELIADLAPKAEYTDKVLQSPTCYTMTQVAKGLSMTVYQLTSLLIQRGIIYHSPSGPYMLYKKYLNQGLEAYRTKCGENLFGEPLWTDTYLVWTEAGRKFINQTLSPTLSRSTSLGRGSKYQSEEGETLKAAIEQAESSLLEFPSVSRLERSSTLNS